MLIAKIFHGGEHRSLSTASDWTHGRQLMQVYDFTQGYVQWASGPQVPMCHKSRDPLGWTLGATGATDDAKGTKEHSGLGSARSSYQCTQQSGE